MRVMAGVASVAAALPVTTAVAATSEAPQLRFRAAASAVTIERWEGYPRVQLNLGTYVVAENAPLEVWARRDSYRDPIVAELVVRGAGRPRTIPLPPGLVMNFSGFNAFTHVTLKDSSGTVVHEGDMDFCPNSYDTARTRPDAPASSPYPDRCPTLPFTLGSVWGVQVGWSALTASDDSWVETDLPDGTYTATVSVNQPYRDLFGIPEDQAAATVTATVHTIREEGATAGGRHSASDHSAHRAGAADSTAGLKPAASRPAGPPQAPRGPRPDLRSLPAWSIQLADASDDGRDYLLFNATVWNGGTSPLVVDGFRREGQDVMDAYQYFFDAQGNQTGYAPAGAMEWDPRDGHDHWHFTDFAQYRLLDADKRLVVRSGKEAFCLANTDGVDYTIPNAKWRPINTDLNTSCGMETSPAVRQVLDIGNGDTYTQYLPGQSFDITDVPNGTYYIEVAANPDGRLQELDATNNAAHRQVILGGGPGNRTLEVPPHEGITG